MQVSFKNGKDVAVHETMAFEDIWEPELRVDEAEKANQLSMCVSHYMFVDGKIAGEIYSMTMAELRDDEPDMPDIFDAKYDNAAKVIYASSMAFLPEFQGKGLAKALKAYHMGYLKALGYDLLIGHATHDGMDTVNDFFGARFLSEHENWYDTGRTARFYEIDL
jgi:GNAT superfamily N-acetyltransferase